MFLFMVTLKWNLDSSILAIVIFAERGANYSFRHFTNLSLGSPGN
jgi:hypothetical protein